MTRSPAPSREARSVARFDPRFEARRDPPGGARGGARGRGRRGPPARRGLDHDAAALLAAEERLSRIYSLERRYGEDEAAVIAHGERAEAEIERLEGLDDERRGREADDARLLLAVAAAAGVLSQRRREAAERLGAAADEALRRLGFRAGAFAVDVGRRPAGSDEAAVELDGDAVAFDATGADEVVFRFAPNPGEPARPLAKIASGGELEPRRARDQAGPRRSADDTPTLVFDEVDAGIGGRTADPVGRSLWALARSHQVLVVTHLPQIAAHADAHFRIAKRERDGRTVTEVERLDREGRIVELAAMLGGARRRASSAATPGSARWHRRPAGLVAMGPRDPATARRSISRRPSPRDLAPRARRGRAAGRRSLASARELLDAAEAWRGRPVVPA